MVGGSAGSGRPDGDGYLVPISEQIRKNLTRSCLILQTHSALNCRATLRDPVETKSISRR